MGMLSMPIDGPRLSIGMGGYDGPRGHSGIPDRPVSPPQWLRNPQRFRVAAVAWAARVYCRSYTHSTPPGPLRRAAALPPNWQAGLGSRQHPFGWVMLVEIGSYGPSLSKGGWHAHNMAAMTLAYYSINTA